MRTKELLAAAKPFMSEDGTVDYLVSMIKSFEAQLGSAAVSMKARMEMLEKATKGEPKFSYMYRSANGDSGTELDVLQSVVYELACVLQVVLKNSHGIEIEEE